jgi:threonine synthase
VAVQSSGNVGAAAAAYAAKAGLRAKILVPRTAPPEKILQAQMYGADVFRVDHDSPAAIFDLLHWACDEFRWHLVSTAAIYNPFTLEGAKPSLRAG